jgi:hypothetical protein
MWPGNTADVKSLIPAVDRLQRRFRIDRVCVLAGRGMISAETIAELEARGPFYVRKQLIEVCDLTDNLYPLIEPPAFFRSTRKRLARTRPIVSSLTLRVTAAGWVG